MTAAVNVAVMAACTSRDGGVLHTAYASIQGTMSVVSKPAVAAAQILTVGHGDGCGPPGLTVQYPAKSEIKVVTGGTHSLGTWMQAKLSNQNKMVVMAPAMPTWATLG